MLPLLLSRYRFHIPFYWLHSGPIGDTTSCLMICIGCLNVQLRCHHNYRNLSGGYFVLLPVSVGPKQSFLPYVYSRTCKACGFLNSMVVKYWHTTSERKDFCRRRIALHSTECCGNLKSHVDENRLESHGSSLSFLILP